MKTRILLFVGILLLAGCQKGWHPELNIPESSYTVGETATAVRIAVQSNTAWSAVSDSPWCTPNKESGENDGTVTLKVVANTGIEKRTATVRITCDGLERTVLITQAGAALFELPVVFHVLYHDASDPLQNVPQERIREILDGVNRYYSDNVKSLDMRVQFTLAQDGIEHIQWYAPAISCETFMNIKKTDDPQYFNLMDDPNRVINIFLYHFTETGVTGIAHLPYCTQEDPLAGLRMVEQNTISLSELGYCHSVSINSSYINDGRDEYSPDDVTVTLVHELGHYLGLHHAFSEADDGSYLNGCKDTDYCADTPSYNRVAYEAEMNAYLDTHPETVYLSDVAKRTDCGGNEFTSTNIMDYWFSYQDRFTANQRERIRFVVNYSPLLPTPRNAGAQTYSGTGEILDLPMRTRI